MPLKIALDKLVSKLADDDWRCQCLICGKKIYKGKEYVLGHYVIHHAPELQSLMGSTVLLSCFALTRKECVDNFMRLIINENLSFKFFDQLSAQLLFKVFTDLFGITCSAEAMAQLLSDHSQMVRDNIKEELEDRMISLKIGIAALRRGGVIMGITAHFIEDWKAEIRYLCMEQIAEDTTAENLRKMIKDCMAEFGLGVDNVYSVTTEFDSNEMNPSEPPEISDEEHVTIELEVPKKAAAVEDEITITVETDLEAVLKEAVREIFNVPETMTASKVIQLAVRDFLADRQLFLTQLKEVVIAVQNYIESRPSTDKKPKKPKLANDSNWESTFEMLKTLHELKDFLFWNSSDIVVDWDQVEDIVKVLEPIHTLAMDEKKEQHTAGDFLMNIILARHKLGQINKYRPTAGAMDLALWKHSVDLIRTTQFAASLYMDPRVLKSALFEPEFQESVIDYLEKIWRQIDPEVGKRIRPVSPSEIDFVRQVQDPASAEEEIQRMLEYSQMSPRQRIETLQEIPRLPSKTKVITYWDAKKNDDKDLSELAALVLALPMTQHTAAKSFNCLHEIQGMNGTCLGSQITKDLWNIRFNA